MADIDSKIPADPSSAQLIGIDPGIRNLGIVVLSQLHKQKRRVIFSETVKPTVTLSRRERLYIIWQRVQSILDEFSGAEIVSMEDQIGVSAGKRVEGKPLMPVVPLFQIMAIVETICWQQARTLVEVRPQSVRKRVVGTASKVSKERLQLLLKPRLHNPDQLSSEHEWDAAAIAIAGAFEKGLPAQQNRPATEGGWAARPSRHRRRKRA